METAVADGILWLFRFVAGASIFSFVNVVVYRFPRGISVVSGRSHCPACGRTLGPAELIPCVSYLLLRGKCSGCGGKILFRYFLTECLGGVLFCACCVRFGCGQNGILSARGLTAFLYLAILTAVAQIDRDTRLIYDRFHVGTALLGVASQVLFPEHSLTDRLVGTLAVALPMLALTVLVKGAFGGGDIKLMAVSGFLLGTRAIITAMFVGILTGGVYAIVMLLRKRLGRRDSFAFGPFLAFGLGLSFFYGDEIANWYLSILGI